MLLNTIVGFFIPWVFGIILYLKEKHIVLLITPFSSAVSCSINCLGFNLGLWHFSPTKYFSLSALPLNLGLFAILGVFLVYLIKNIKLNPLLIISAAALITTLLEYIGVVFNRVFYANGWNIIWTFFSYLIAYILVFLYYHLLTSKLNVFNR